ncbi:MAG: nodulation protein NfeD [Desulfotomaculaceae bacterium]|nr:nodulation protein NfeD [Desulfotomaculaceae bacterium]
MKLKKCGFLLCLIIFSSMWLCFAAPSPGQNKQPAVYSIKIDETVTEGTARHIQRGLRMAEKNQADAVLILLNTPGGLVSATLDILQAMSASNVPIITYVNPQGAIAASAGTFILINGHIAAMSPATTCGAAMPVTMATPGESPQTADQKTINFLAGHMKSIAAERGRPADLAEKFVTENLTLNNSEALDKGMVDINAADTVELLKIIDGRTVKTNAGERRLTTAGAGITELPLTVNEQLFHLVSNPTFAMILLMVGIYGLIIGFYSPGFLLPEIAGSISIILGLAGMGLFRGNLTAVFLILLGTGLLVAEFVTPTYGVLGVGGLISIVLGILFFPVEPLMPAGWFSAFKLLVLGVGVVGAILLSIIVMGVSRIRRHKPVHGEVEFQNKTAYAVTELDPGGMIRIRGEIWQAMAKNGHTILQGEKVKVLERQGMTLFVTSIVNNDDTDPVKKEED